MGSYEVDPAQLQQVDALLEDCAAQARRALTGVSSSARALIGGWAGPAGAAFALGWDEWFAGALDLLAALDEMGRAVGASGRGYATTEDAVRAGVTQVSA